TSSSAPSASYRRAAPPRAPAARRVTKVGPLTTRPRATSRQGRMGFSSMAGPRLPRHPLAYASRRWFPRGRSRMMKRSPRVLPEVLAVMRYAIVTAAVLAAVAGVMSAAEPIKSGLQVGEFVLPFEPYNVTGEFAGQEKCLVCLHGASPVACVFA